MRSKRRKPDTARLSGIERLLLGLVTLFFCASILRGVAPASLRQAQTTVQTWLTGQLDLEQVIAAVGRFAEREQLQAAFQEWFPAPYAEDGAPAADGYAIESAAPTDRLAAQAASLFPKEEDTTVYPLSFACRVPVQGTVSSRFGARTHPVTGQPDQFHGGLDIAAPQGTPIRALADGRILQTGDNSYGLYLILDHGGGLASLYAHCSKLLVQEGQAVHAGDVLAEVGATGMATGDHLHLEIWRAGKRLNPEDYVMLT